MKFILLIFSSLFTNLCIAKDKVDTSEVKLQPVNVKLYFSKQNNLSSTTSSQYLPSEIIQEQNNTNLTHAINTIPGVRMEERSPGSYRLAIRGGMLRSPFGVRNTKIYLGDFPLTDAGGNTYINLINNQSLSAVQVIKGPDASLFGANSAGVIQLTPNGWNEADNKTQFELSGGSYNTIKEHIGINRTISPKYSFSIDQSYAKSDGYRDHSGSKLNTLQTIHNWHYTSSASLKALLIYSDLGYNTPGGLTAAQYTDNPKSARPATNTTASAQEQHAGIYNKTVFAGLSNQWKIKSNLIHHISLYGSHTNFENPFISNYEIRKEENIGLRTFFSLSGKQHNLPWEMQLGYEGAKGWYNIENYDNIYGIAGKEQALDKIQNYQWNAFYRVHINLLPNWLLEGSLGLNKFAISDKQLFPNVSDSKESIKFNTELLPRIATSYLITPSLSWRASISKGYSTPTIAEIRSSNNIFNPNIQAELGTNYETGLKYKTTNQKFLIDIASYTYQLKNGIVRQLDSNGEEYYKNAGEVNQKGIELAAWYYIPIQSNWLNEISYQLATTYNHYRFGDYVEANKDYTGNKLTSVPDYTIFNSIQLNMRQKVAVHITHQFTSSIPLNDANTVFSDKYHLVRSSFKYKSQIFKKNIQYVCSIDNILNENYSLGNDINAFGGRYFNAAPARNYTIGIKLNL